jgi:hypothetical protein
MEAYLNEWIPRVTILAVARVVAGRIAAEGALAAGPGQGAFVQVLAMLLAVAGKAGLALAQEVRRQVAALGVLDASRRESWVVALVDV